MYAKRDFGAKVVLAQRYTRGVQAMTSGERARRFKARQAQEGLAQLNVWVPRIHHADLRRLVEMLRENPDVRVVSVTMQDLATGRMRGVKLR